ncbi:MAG: hypothetical protein K2L67_06625 [Clostridia bacterium]|nr:hypothetical protein [Clostridia bacterium]
MRLAIVCNNYGQNYDGIGSFAKVMNENYPDYVTGLVFSSNCLSDSSAIKKVFDFGMVKALHKARYAVKNREVDAIIIEYPFVEWNPFIIAAIRKLHIALKKINVKLFASIHEFERVNVLRKLVIKRIVKYSDALFVSDSRTQELLSVYNPKIFIRNIPSNIQLNGNINFDLKSRNNYAYFGLINSAKAFDEMLTAWDNFNNNKQYTLYIMTATKFEGIEESHNNIRFCYRYSDAEIGEIMEKCAFCLLPVKPQIDSKNGTFKTSCLYGCLGIGCFCSEYSNLPFNINMDNYSINSFIKALNKSQDIADGDIICLSRKATEFSKKFMPEHIANYVAEQISKELDEIN